MSVPEQRYYYWWGELSDGWLVYQWAKLTMIITGEGQVDGFGGRMRCHEVEQMRKPKELMEIRENKSIEHEKGFFPFSSFYNFPFPHTIFHPLVGVPCLSSSLCNTHPHIICINNYLRRHIHHFSDFHHSQIQTLRPPNISHCPFHCLFHSTTQSIKPFFIFSV